MTARATRNAVFDEGLNKELILFSRGSGPSDASTPCARRTGLRSTPRSPTT